MNLNLNSSILAYKLYTLTTLVITLMIIGQIVPIQINACKMDDHWQMWTKNKFSLYLCPIVNHGG
jgi:hypothetical protein